jgi:hypothetical protein
MVAGGGHTLNTAVARSPQYRQPRRQRLARDRRLREKSRRYPDERLDAIVAEVEQAVPERGRPAANHLGYAVPLRLRSPNGELTLPTTLAHFATAIDVTVSEFSFEAFLPGDAATAEALAIADRGGPAG